MKTKKKIEDFFPKGHYPSETQKEFAQSIINYRKAGIEFEELDWDEKESDFFKGATTKVKITQTRLINGYILSQKQLVERAKSVYKCLGWDVRVTPVVYSLNVNEITLEWITNKMEDFGIKRNDIIKQLAIDKSSLSLIFSGNTELSNRTKAAFFFYFLTYELNRDLRA